MIFVMLLDDSLSALLCFLFGRPQELALELLLMGPLVVHPPIARSALRSFRRHPTRVALRVHRFFVITVPLSARPKPCNLPRPDRTGARW